MIVPTAFTSVVESLSLISLSITRMNGNLQSIGPHSQIAVGEHGN